MWLKKCDSYCFLWKISGKLVLTEWELLWVAEVTLDAAGEPLSAPAHSPFKVLSLLLLNWPHMVKYAKMNKIYIGGYGCCLFMHWLRHQAWLWTAQLCSCRLFPYVGLSGSVITKFHVLLCNSIPVKYLFSIYKLPLLTSWFCFGYPLICLNV